jgi:hypothetical protein
LAVTRSADEVQLAEKLMGIFMPYAAGKNTAAISQKTRFVHYTSAVAGLEIIRSKRLWMRSTTCMSDYREVQHGFATLNKYFGDQTSREAFFKAVNACAAGAAEEAIQIFNQWWNATQFQTYVACMSEHDGREDLHGRLSMWRAFGRTTTRVALVCALPLSSGVALPLNIIFSPVAYFNDEQVCDEMNRVIANIYANEQFLRTLERQRILQTLFAMLLSAVVGLKHEGFHEEREWRAICSPKRTPSPFIESSTENVDGVPQLVYKIPLDVTVAPELSVLDVAAVLDRVIIGPSQYSWAMYEAYVAALGAVGVVRANERVFMSGIPVRTGP